MKIYVGGSLVDFPEWIAVDSSSGGVKTDSEELNDRDGELYINEKLKAKQFECSGVIQNTDVDKEVSRITSLIAGKELKVYRDDDSEIFYRCRLINDVKVYYYRGVKIKNAFKIGFSLKCYDGYGESAEVVQTLSSGSNTVPNIGNLNVTPQFTIAGAKTVSGTVFSVGKTSIKVTESIEIPSGQNLVINDIGMWLHGVDITDKLDDTTLITPLSLAPGSNTLTAAVIASVSFYPRYK